MSEAAVKRSDLANFDPDTPLEKLRWAREEMQRNFQQPISARAMRVCTVCSERWDTAEDGEQYIDEMETRFKKGD